jgi:hypothetical protein
MLSAKATCYAKMQRNAQRSGLAVRCKAQRSAKINAAQYNTKCNVGAVHRKTQCTRSDAKHSALQRIVQKQNAVLKRSTTQNAVHTKRSAKLSAKQSKARCKAKRNAVLNSAQCKCKCSAKTQHNSNRNTMQSKTQYVLPLSGFLGP